MGIVPTPDVYVCTENDKKFSRFFYVINGTITFDKGTEKEITASAGTIVYLPNNITYKSEWSAGTDGKYISVNFQLDELYITLPDSICIAAVDRNSYLSDVSVSELAEMCSTCESNFRRLFRRYKKMSPVTYKNYLRIQKACDLLRTGEYSVTEAAYAVNIDDISYFHKLFTRFTGCTPKQFIP